MVAISDAARAQGIWRKIQRKPSSVVLTRLPIIVDDAAIPSSTTLAAQTVRVARDNRPRAIRGASGEGTELHCIVYGVRDHPDAAIVDTDIERGDTFALEGDHYVVDYINFVPGGVQATCLLQGIGT